MRVLFVCAGLKGSWSSPKENNERDGNELRKNGHDLLRTALIMYSGASY